MSEFYSDGQVTLYHGEARDVLAQLPAGSVQCVVTSPPYWGLRDYGTAQWEPMVTDHFHTGQDCICIETMNECDHRQQLGGEGETSGKQNTSAGTQSHQYRDVCGKCGARRIDRQLGLEPTPEAYVDAMVDVFRHVRRVLRDDGTLWLNIGDTYAAQRGGSAMPAETLAGGVSGHGDKVAKRGRESEYLAHRNAASYGLKHKDLVGIPWLLAFALRADGWWLRQDIIWSKPNPMPESVRDRCTKAHEMIFLLSKSARYFFDADAIREGVSETGVIERTDCYDESLVLLQNLRAQMASTDHALGAPLVSRGNRGGIFERGVRHATAILQRAQRQDNLSLPTFDAEVGQKRGDRGAGLSVVHVPVIRRAAMEAARFADGDISAKEFLEEVDRLCVALPDGDDFKEAWCADFSSPAFIHTNGDRPVAIHDASKVGQIEFVHNQQSTIARASSYSGRNKRSVWHIATAPFPEAHFATFPPALVEPCILAGSREGDVVLDPFIGSGTTAMVARQLGRRAIGIDLNSEYLAMARRRVGEQLALLGDAR